MKAPAIPVSAPIKLPAGPCSAVSGTMPLRQPPVAKQRRLRTERAMKKTHCVAQPCIQARPCTKGELTTLHLYILGRIRRIARATGGPRPQAHAAVVMPQRYLPPSTRGVRDYKANCARGPGRGQSLERLPRRTTCGRRRGSGAGCRPKRPSSPQAWRGRLPLANRHSMTNNDVSTELG